MVRETCVRIVILSVFVSLLSTLPGVSGRGDAGINPLRFKKGQRKWQVTLNISRSISEVRRLSLEPTGLWEERSSLADTSVSISSTFDVNESIGLQGGLTWVVNEGEFSKTNLWTGRMDQAEKSEDELAGGKLMIKYVLWQNSELKAYFLLPVFGKEATAGLTWSQDPIMVFPRATLSGERLTLDSTVSFVANSAFALTGSGSFSYSEEQSVLGFGGGVVYRNGKYDGIKVTASVEKGRTTKLSLGVGFTYGEEK